MIDTSRWKEFKVSDIFRIVNGKGLTLEEIEENEGDIPCIQGGASNNGSIGNIKLEYCTQQNYCIVEGPCLTVARVGTAGYVNYWDCKCAIGDKCKALLFRENHSNLCYLFLQAILQQLSYKYSYGRGLSISIYANEVIMLPATSSGEPDWQFMEEYMDGLASRAYHNFGKVFSSFFGNGEVGRI